MGHLLEAIEWALDRDAPFEGRRQTGHIERTSRGYESRIRWRVRGRKTA